MKKYHVTQHACIRAAERLGVAVEHAPNHLNQLMQTAFLQGNTINKYGSTRVFDHYKSKTRLIVSDSDSVVTVYRFPEEEVAENKPQSLPNVFAEEVRQVIQRKFNKAERDFKRKERVLSIELAEFNLEIAQLHLSYAKAKSPKVREQLSEKIGELDTKAARIQFEIDEAAKAFEEVNAGAEAFL